MTADSLLIRAQAAALRLMVDTCVIKRITSHFTDGETGIITSVYSTVYTGVCRVQRRTFFDRPHNAGEANELLLAVELQIPVSVVGVASEDIVTMLTSLHDADLVGRVFHVRGLSHKSHASARHFQCIEINS